MKALPTTQACEQHLEGRRWLLLVLLQLQLLVNPVQGRQLELPEQAAAGLQEAREGVAYLVAEEEVSDENTPP